MSEKVSIYPILTVNFIGTLGFSIVLPFLVFLVTRFGGNAGLYGLLGATYPAFQLIGAPILGRWSDQIGRRKVLLLSQTGTLLSWLIFLAALLVPISTLAEIENRWLGKFALTLPLLILFFARALDGITGGNISVANAYLADITDDRNRSRNFGKMAVSSNLGFIFGPILAGLLGGTALQETLPVLAAIAISLAATLIIAFYLPESRPCVLQREPHEAPVRKVFGQENKDCYKIEGENAITLMQLLRRKSISFMLAIYFFIFLAFTFFYTAFPVHVVQALQWSITELGIFFSFLSGMMILVQGPILSRLSKRFSDASLIIFGNLVLGTNFVFMTSENLAFIYVGALLFAIGNGLMWPSVLALLSKIAGEKYQGSVHGFAGSFGSLASIVGLIVGGVLYGAVGATTFLVSAGVIYFIFGLSFRLLAVEKALRGR